jgi:hypothetical protein
MSCYWQPRLIWAIQDGEENWTREIFQPSTAYFVAGGWSPDPEAAKQRAGPGGIVEEIPGGWDHEHCDICNRQIVASESYFRSENYERLCESCYLKTVPTGDLSEFTE